MAEAVEAPCRPTCRRPSQRGRAGRGEPFLERYGGRISSEWYFPKLIELWAEDREVYEACEVFLEATDWIVWWLTGQLVRQSTTAGYKAMWSPSEGLPPSPYFEAAYPGLRPTGGEARHALLAARHAGGRGAS